MDAIKGFKIVSLCENHYRNNFKTSEVMINISSFSFVLLVKTAALSGFFINFGRINSKN